MTKWGQLRHRQHTNRIHSNHPNFKIKHPEHAEVQSILNTVRKQDPRFPIAEELTILSHYHTPLVTCTQRREICLKEINPKVYYIKAAYVTSFEGLDTNCDKKYLSAFDIFGIAQWYSVPWFASLWSIGGFCKNRSILISKCSLKCYIKITTLHFPQRYLLLTDNIEDAPF